MGFVHGTPGLTTIRSILSGGGGVATSCTCTPCERSRPASRCSTSVSALSKAKTLAPRLRKSSMAAKPLAPRPRTKTRLFSSRTIESRLAYLQCAQGHDRAQDRKDEEAHDHLRFMPAFLFEMMVEWRHQKNPSPDAVPLSRVLEIDCLQQH